MKSFFDSVPDLSVVEIENTLFCQVNKLLRAEIKLVSVFVIIKDTEIFVKGSIYSNHSDKIMEKSVALALFEPYKKDIEKMDNERVKEQLLNALF